MSAEASARMSWLDGTGWWPPVVRAPADRNDVRAHLPAPIDFPNDQPADSRNRYRLARPGSGMPQPIKSRKLAGKDFSDSLLPVSS